MHGCCKCEQQISSNQLATFWPWGIISRCLANTPSKHHAWCRVDVATGAYICRDIFDNYFHVGVCTRL